MADAVPRLFEAHVVFQSIDYLERRLYVVVFLVFIPLIVLPPLHHITGKVMRRVSLPSRPSLLSPYAIHSYSFGQLQPEPLNGTSAELWSAIFLSDTLLVALISSSVVMTDVFAAPVEPHFLRSVAKRQVTVDSTTLSEIANEISVSQSALEGVTAIVTSLTATLQEIESQLGIDGSNDGSDDSGNDAGGDSTGDSGTGGDDGTGDASDGGDGSTGDSGTGGDGSTDPSGSTDGSDDSGADDGSANDNSD
ncbi:hypothetical protein Clacol_010069 [Clathrus columnatus]|uniref:Uncharacterized protein n=1 Tax=Clathrus columnatus TaxID=1419009 RepID=A0AAV5ASQ3_9AGAM|nr:hypothetical protein Clacol_010069 [Clathrus columnatus]